MDEPHEYSRKKKRSGDREAAVSRSGRDIGLPPRIKNKRRRNSAVKSFRYFLTKYFPETIYLKLSKDHEKAIKRIEWAVKSGGRFAFAMPRGSGKTTFTELAVLWAILTARRKFVAIIGSDKPSAIAILDSIKTELETNDLLFEDFPEVCHPIRCLEGEARRCVGQHIEGVRTRIQWGADELVFPYVDGSPASESVIRVAGITGRIRGMKYKTTAGTTLRPDLAIVDDPQTEESAYSDPQCDSRERAIKRAVCRLAGPGKDIAVFMPCTVIRKGDLADRFLNQKLNPNWNGLRTKMLEKFPANMDLWEQYDDIRRRELEEGQEPDESRAFYRKRKKKMNKGAKVGWKERKSAGDVDALQHAMDLYFEDPAGFLAEFNNDPQEDLAAGQVELQTAEAIMQRTNGYDRGAVPSWATKITAFVDVQQDCLFWLVAAWSDDFRGAVIDYGCFPDQKRTYFTKADIRKTLRKVLGVKSIEGGIRKGLDELVGTLMAWQFPTEDGGQMVIDRLAIDASYEQTLVYSFCRSFGDARVTPHHGKYYGAETTPMSQYKPKPGEKIGHHWLRPAIRGQRLAVRHFVADSNFWKSFVHSRLSIEVGAPGDLTLFGSRRDQRYHRLLADHLRSQQCVLMDARGIGTKAVWKRHPSKDHDWFDCLYGAAVLACVEGSSLPEWNRRRPRKTQRSASAGMSLAERRAAKRRKRDKR